MIPFQKTTSSHSFQWPLHLSVACSFFCVTTAADAQVAAKPGALFKEASNEVIPFEDKNRRKWDNALIADLDQDGEMDILITEHAHQASIYWNNGGTFSKPQKVIGGDTHGVAAGDYDQDGRIDLIIYQGGGGGKNPRMPVEFHVNRDRTLERGKEFSHFEKSRGRAAKLVDVDNDGSLDMILTAFPLPTQKKGANHLYKNGGEKDFEFVTHLPRAKWMGFKSLVTDFNNDGIYDVLFYGGKNIIAAQGTKGMSYQSVTPKVLGKLSNTGFTSSIAEIDYDNDGDMDLFITRADHYFDSKTYHDCDACRFAFFSRSKKNQYEDLKIDGDLKVENLQMAFPHFNVYVGKDKRLLEFEEKHPGKHFSLKPNEAEGWPDDVSAKGLYIGHVGDGMWRLSADTNSPTAAVIHNVKSTPEVSKIKDMPAKLFENRDGVFVDVTADVGINVAEQTTSSAIGDFDNNGWNDLFIVRNGNPASPTEQILYLNNGGKFTRAKNHGITSSELGSTGGGADPLDYDQDGDLDIVMANERGQWRLFTNNGLASGNNYIVVKVGASPSKKATSQGAVLTLKAGDQIFKRVVGSTSAGFSHSLNSHLHVGLGKIKAIDSAVVTWTNGETETLKIDKLNQSVQAGLIK